ncbi:MAG: hypothetical protein WC100_08195 [Sterolibacterium sp.]
MSKINQLLAKWACCLAIAGLAAQSHGQTISQSPLIAAGANHSIVLKSDGSLWAWGNNESGQLGDGTTTNSSSPKRIDDGYTSILTGYAQSFGTKSDNSFWGWGNNLQGQYGEETTLSNLQPMQVNNNFTVIATGINHTIAIHTDGTLWSWGSNGYGQLGDSTRTDNFTPTQVPDTATCTGPYLAIAVGFSHSVALQDDGTGDNAGTVCVWGYNWAGQVGDDSTLDGLEPKMIDVGPAGAPIRIKAIAAGASHTLALGTDDTLWAWGNNQNGQLGDATLVSKHVPTKVGTLAVSAIAAGYSHSVALLKSATVTLDGGLYAWGGNAYGQLGDGTRVDSPTPKKIGTALYSAIASGLRHNLALLKTDNSVWAWGSNTSGQIGDGTTTDSLVPKKIVTGYTSDISAPTVPTGLTILSTSTDGTQVNLAWNAATDNIDVTTYKVYLAGSLVATLGNVTTYTGTASSTSQYTVAACDAAGNCSEQSEGVYGTPMTTVGPSISVDAGWNLLGNSYNTPFQVASVFGNSTMVWAVWKWTVATGKWSFYTPTISDGGSAYAASNGFDLLTTVNGGEGFWVNAKQAFSAQLPAGTVISSSSFSTMKSGWNLIAVGDNQTPSRFNAALTVNTSSGSNPPSPSVVPVNLNSLWLWDNKLSNWYFYAASLEAKGGTALTDYITSKGYLDFTASKKTLGVGAGFWVNKP